MPEPRKCFDGCLLLSDEFFSCKLTSREKDMAEEPTCDCDAKRRAALLEELAEFVPGDRATLETTPGSREEVWVSAIKVHYIVKPKGTVMGMGWIVDEDQLIKLEAPEEGEQDEAN